MRRFEVIEMESWTKTKIQSAKVMNKRGEIGSNRKSAMD
jgi:hypothetical protein